MKFIYPAIFSPRPEGGYSCRFPDLDGCVADGDTLEEAIEEANHAAAGWIGVELEEEVPEMPPVSELSDLQLCPGEVGRYIAVNIRFYDGWDE